VRSRCSRRPVRMARLRASQRAGRCPRAPRFSAWAFWTDDRASASRQPRLNVRTGADRNARGSARQRARPAARSIETQAQIRRSPSPPRLLPRWRQASESFLAKAAAEPGAQKLESGLVYLEVTPGTGASPGANDTVKVHYHGTLRDGTVFDSSVERGTPAEFPLDRVIPCWSEACRR
jgi:FKBP-type peptidyl-prolyl cis-trans isomerase